MGFDSSAVDAEGSTGLILAAKSGQENAVMALARASRTETNELNATDEQGYTALHWAVANGDLNIVETLVNSGCDLSVVSEDGTTPLYIAEAEGFEEIFYLLKNRGGLYGEQVVSYPSEGLDLANFDLDDTPS